MEILTPVHSPWQTDSAFSNPKLTAIGDDFARVEMNVSFCNIASSKNKSDGKIEYDYPLSRIAIRFKHFHTVRMRPDPDDLDSLYNPEYSYDLIPYNDVQLEDTIKWRTLFDSSWSSGSCPDPGMYIVEDSTWIDNRLKKRLGMKHYVILAADTNIDILASDWTWNKLYDIEIN